MTISPEVAAARDAARPFIEGLKQVSERTGMPALGSVRTVPIGAVRELNHVLDGILAGAMAFVVLKDENAVPWLGIGTISGGQAKVPIYTRLDFMGAAEPTETSVKLTPSPTADIAIALVVSLLLSDIHLAADSADLIWVYAVDAPIKDMAPSTLPVACLRQNFTATPLRTDQVEGYHETMEEIHARWTAFMAKMNQTQELMSAPSNIILPN